MSEDGSKIVPRHKDFRLFATVNPPGGRYKGRIPLSAEWISRWNYQNVGELPKEIRALRLMGGGAGGGKKKKKKKQFKKRRKQKKKNFLVFRGGRGGETKKKKSRKRGKKGGKAQQKECRQKPNLSP